MDGHGKLCPRRVGGKNVYTKAGGCPLLNAQALLPHGREGRVELAKRDWTQTETAAEVGAEAKGGA